jgi:hypothetical protein
MPRGNKAEKDDFRAELIIASIGTLAQENKDAIQNHADLRRRLKPIVQGMPQPTTHIFTTKPAITSSKLVFILK